MPLHLRRDGGHPSHADPAQGPLSSNPCSGADVGSTPLFSHAGRVNGSLYVDHLPGA